MNFFAILILISSIFSFSGHITQNTTWDEDIIITGDTWVDPGVTLTIMPGVTVYFTRTDANSDGLGDTDFIIEGRVISQGMSDEKVYFTSYEENPQPNDWAGIDYLSSDDSELTTLSNTEILYGHQGFNINGRNVLFNACRIAHSDDFGLRIESTTYNSSLNNCIIENNGGYGMLIENGTVDISNLTIFNNNGWGLKVLSDGNFNADDLTISSNTDQGLWIFNTLDEPTLTDGRIISNNDGIVIDGATPTISNSNISNNNGYGVKINNSDPIFDFCDIKNNSLDGFLYENLSSGSVSNSFISENGGYGVKLLYDSTPQFNNNHIYSNFGNQTSDNQTLTIYPDVEENCNFGGNVNYCSDCTNLQTWDDDITTPYPVKITNIKYTKGHHGGFTCSNTRCWSYQMETYVNINGQQYAYHNLSDSCCGYQNGNTCANLRNNNYNNYGIDDAYLPVQHSFSINTWVNDLQDFDPVINFTFSNDCYECASYDDNEGGIYMHIDEIQYQLYEDGFGYQVYATNTNSIVDFNYNWWNQITNIDELIYQLNPGTVEYANILTEPMDEVGSSLDNLLPSLSILEPSEFLINPDSVNIVWEDLDVDDDANISFYYTENINDSGNLIVAGLSEDDNNDSYTWNLSEVPHGTYYIYAEITDNVNDAIVVYAPYQVMVGPLSVNIPFQLF